MMEKRRELDDFWFRGEVASAGLVEELVCLCREAEDMQLTVTQAGLRLSLLNEQELPLGDLVAGRGVAGGGGDSNEFWKRSFLLEL